MAERSARPWPMRAAFVVLAIGILLLQLLPLRTTPPVIAGSDLLVAMIFAWGLRRPDYVPAPIIAGVMLLADLMLGRPPGLWAALVLIGAEWIKAQGRRPVENTFFAEWLSVAVVLLAITVVYRLILGLTLVAHGSLLLYASQYLLTVLVYPLVVLAGWLLFRLRHTQPGEFDPQTRTGP